MVEKEDPEQRMDRLLKEGICPYCEKEMIEGLSAETACCKNYAIACRIVHNLKPKEVGGNKEEKEEEEG
jgi:hypothetical protein